MIGTAPLGPFDGDRRPRRRSASGLLAHPVLRLTARIVAIAGVVAGGIFCLLLSFLVAPMPWPIFFAVVWLGFVAATIAAAYRWAYRPLAIAATALPRP